MYTSALVHTEIRYMRRTALAYIQQVELLSIPCCVSLP